ncbi:MAG: hypothetical protein RI894_1738 [Bacteroidota bacterium]|jgi:hypothetical protein
MLTKSIFSSIALCILCTTGFAQTASFKNLQSTSAEGKRTFRFPIVELENPTTAANINSELAEEVINRLFETNMPLVRTMELPDAIAELAKNACSSGKCSITGLDYKVLYNKNGLLSLKFTFENVQNPLWEKDFYFNFDLKTGAYLKIKDIVEPTQMPALMAHFYQNVALRNDIAAAKILNHDNFKADAAAQKRINDCLEKVAKPILRDFAFTENGLTLVTDYQSFVDILQAKPKDDFLYDYKFVRFFLNPTIVQSLHVS